MRFRSVPNLTVSALALLSALPVLAAAEDAPVQVSQTSNAQPQSQGLQTIVVTAEKRKQDIKDIPASLSAIGGDALEATHIADYDDITRALPGISFGSGGGEGLANIEIRGISSTSGSATVGLYLDGVSITTKNFYDGATQPQLFDMDRIEVLRGPQGTLYGASSMGGTINFVTKQPVLDTTDGSVTTDLSGTFHGGVNYSGNGVVNIPVIPGEGAIRLGIAESDESGYIDNYANIYGVPGGLKNTGVNDERATVLHLTGLFEPGDGWTITPAVFYQRDQTGDNSVFYPSLGLWKQDKSIDEYGRDTDFLPSLTVSKDLGWATLTSITGFFWRDFSRQQDGTYYNSYAFAHFFVDPLYSAPQYAQQVAEVNKYIGNIPSPIKYQTNYGQGSEEIRLNSPSREDSGLPLIWQTGLYYSDQWDHHTNFQRIPGVNTEFANIFGYSMDAPQSLIEQTFGTPGQPLFPGDIDEDDHSHYDERQAAIFGQTEVDILPDLHGTVGLRYVFARADYNFQTLGFYQIGNISPYNQLDRYYALTPKFSLDYDVTPETSVYATAAKGFRLGGPTGPVPFGPTTVCGGDEAAQGITSQPRKFDSDKLWSYELGTKNRLDDNRLSIDGAIYYVDWKDIQQQIYLPTCGYYYTTNAGDAESYGAELEVHYLVMKGLTVGGSATGEHAVITRSNDPLTVAVGEKILNTPDWALSLSSEYDWPVGDDSLAFVRGDYSWDGRSHGSYIVTNSNYSNPQYDVLNASVGVKFSTFEVSLYAKNLTNDRTIIQRPEINTVIEGYTVRPLTVGVTVKVPFGD